jgi:ABC-type transport system involved in multi-copper enzyme maturation permease subunit
MSEHEVNPIRERARLLLHEISIWTRYDLAASFKSPILEGVFFILLASTLVPALLGIQKYWIPFVTSFNGIDSDILETIEAFNKDFSTVTLLSSLFSVGQLAIFITPLLLSFSFAQPLEDGSIRTLLSYPIKRSHFLTERFALPVIFTAGISSICSLGINYLLIPGNKDLEVFVLSIVFLWLLISLVTVCAILIGILTRNAVLTLVFGSGVWFLGNSFIVTSSETSIILRGLFSPMTVMLEYVSQGFNAPPISDIYILLNVFPILIMLISAVSYVLFRRLEL